MRPYDEFKSAMLREYQTFAVGLRGHYLSVLASSGRAASPESVRHFTRAAQVQSEAFLMGASERMVSYLAQHSNGSDCDAHSNAFARQCASVASAHVAELRRRLATGNPDIKLVLQDAHGAIGLLLQQRQMQQPDMKARDSAGRSWEASKLVAVTARDFAYQSLLEGQIQALREAGQAEAQAVYPDGQSAGMVGLAEDSPYPAIEVLRAELFHPNATAELAHV